MRRFLIVILMLTLPGMAAAERRAGRYGRQRRQGMQAQAGRGVTGRIAPGNDTARQAGLMNKTEQNRAKTVPDPVIDLSKRLARTFDGGAEARNGRVIRTGCCKDDRVEPLAQRGKCSDHDSRTRPLPWPTSR